MSNFDTLISSKAEITGDIKVNGGLHVDGKIKGNIVADAKSGAVIRISDKGIVEGEIHAPHIIINGAVVGNVFSSEHIELAKKAAVTGDVHYVMMEMVMGAKVNGKLLHSPEMKGKNKLLSNKEEADKKSQSSNVSPKTPENKHAPFTANNT